MGVFKIDVDDFKWIDGTLDDVDDLCLHGHVTVQIGTTIIEDVGTVSATGLYLLKSLTEDKIMSYHDIQMIPCCGHFMVANKELSEVWISGCGKGTDWSVVHEGENVKIILPDGQEEVVLLEEYRKEVYRFTDKIEAFYDSCTPKVLPNDEFSCNGYIAFWREWHRRREV